MEELLVTPFFSVITVCKNSERTIRNTIDSVLKQSFKSYEFIVIDGLSNDNTLNILKSYDNLFVESNTRFYVLSEEDKGIYDAMNKGIRIAKGRYIIFLNSDDSFYDNDVLINVFQKALDIPADIYYGNTCMVCENNKMYIQVPKKLSPNIHGRMVFIHQSSIIRRELLIKYPFDDRYRISADYNFFYNVFLLGYKFCYCDYIFSNYCSEGISGREFQVRKNEYRTIKKRVLKSNNVGIFVRIIATGISLLYCIRDILRENKILRDCYHRAMAKKD